MSELIVGLIVGLAGGVAVTLHVVRRYLERDGTWGELVRRVVLRRG